MQDNRAKERRFSTGRKMAGDRYASADYAEFVRDRQDIFPSQDIAFQYVRQAEELGL